MAEQKSSFLTIPDIDFVEYNKNMQQIVKLIKNFDQFTQNLEAKVDNLLQAQMDEFIRSYKNHMSKVRIQVEELAEKLKQKQQIIIDYQNEGKMARLLQRVDLLEEKQRKLLKAVENRSTKIKSLQLQIRVQKGQIKRYEDKIKELFRIQANLSEKIDEKSELNIRPRENKSIPTFSTQISPQISNARLSKVLTQERSYQMRNMYKKSQTTINPEEQRVGSLQKMVNQLKKKNRELAYVNSKYFQELSEMETFFLKTVNEIKKNITTRKKIKECSLDDFRKEDKLELLIKILSDDNAVIYLYQTIFGKKDIPLSSEIKESSGSEKIRILQSAKIRLPNISTNRLA